MSGYSPYSGRRRISDRGSSVSVTIPNEGLEEHGLKREDVAGKEVPTVVENGEMKVNLEVLAQEIHDD